MNRPPSQARAEVTGAVLTLPGTGAGRIAPPVRTPHLLSAVTADGPAVWAAGNAGQGPLLARWDPGASSWYVPPAPPVDPALAGVSVQGVAAGAGIVAVGGGFDRVVGTERPLLLHWDATSWTSHDDLPHDRVLTDVVLFDGAGWAVGHGFNRGDADGPLALRLTDGAWTPAPVPAVPRGRLLAVAGTAPDDVWAVGATDRSGLILHHDGRAWSVVPSPPTRFPLTGVTAVSRTSAWAVGRDRVLHWDGRRWSRVKSPVTAANTVAADASGRLWIAGGHGELVRRDGDGWSDAPAPDASAAVWLASTAVGHGVCLVGTRQVTGTTLMGDARTITGRRATDPRGQRSGQDGTSVG